MISLLVGMVMSVSASANTSVDMYCYKAHSDTPSECIWYVNDCVMDGETHIWCLADYEQSIKEGKEE